MNWQPLMTPEGALEVLKYTGFIVTAAASVWGLVAKTTYEDENKRKRLTSAGQVAIGIIIGSAVLSMMAFGFETLVKQNAVENQKAAAARLAAESDRKEQAREARQDRLEERRRGELELQRYIILRNAADERTRQLEIATKVSQGAERNLARTQLALEQIDRTLHPIGLVTLTVVFEIPPTTPGLENLFDQLKRLSEQIRKSPDNVADMPGISINSRSMDGVPLSLELKPESYLTSKDKEPEINSLLHWTGVEVSFFAGQNVRDVIQKVGASRRALGYFGNQGDFAFDIEGHPISAEPATVNYDIETRFLTITLRGKAEERFTRRSGSIASIQDLEKSTIVVGPDYTMLPNVNGTAFPLLESTRRRLSPRSVWVAAGGRDYGTSDFAATATRAGYPVFVAREPLGRSRYNN